MSEYVYATDEHKGHWLTGEEIVRCRDCKFKDEPWNCAAPYYIEPDGFCAWGERRTNDN